jgi:hypothetical protein
MFNQEKLLNETSNYGKSLFYSEELRPLLISYNISLAYTMGIDLVAKYGLKTFLNKFKRKEFGTETSVDLTPSSTPKTQLAYEVESNSQEILFLLADMIRSTEYHHGTK